MSRPIRKSDAEKSLSLAGRIGLAGRTGFYLILTGITVRIAILGGRSPEADAHGALAVVSQSLIGKIAIGAVAVGFLMFGIGRLVGAWQDTQAGRGKRALTIAQGVFYVILAYVPCAFLAGNTQTGSQAQQQKTTGRLLGLPGGRVILVVAGVIMVIVCAQQIRGALTRSFTDGLELGDAPRPVRGIAEVAGVVGITARALVFLPVGIFLLVAAFQNDPNHAYGTDGELLRLSGHPWGTAVLVLVAAGLFVFVIFSAVETRYRQVVSAR